EGIFHIVGREETFLDAKEALDMGFSVDTLEVSVHVCSQLIKAWFREYPLNTPGFLPYELLNSLQSSDEQRKSGTFVGISPQVSLHLEKDNLELLSNDQVNDDDNNNNNNNNKDDEKGKEKEKEKKEVAFAIAQTEQNGNLRKKKKGSKRLKPNLKDQPLNVDTSNAGKADSLKHRRMSVSKLSEIHKLRVIELFDQIEEPVHSILLWLLDLCIENFFFFFFFEKKRERGLFELY
ncbi:hypothetical protein RFI_18724, partial [Reticulomyxa filosa]